MDLLAPIFAYLGTVTAIVAAVVMSYDALIYAPLHQTAPLPIIAAAKPTAHNVAAATKVSRVAEGASTGGTDQKGTPQSVAAAIRQKASTAKAVARRERLRQLARRDREKYWAYQLDPRGGSGTVGYADERPAWFGGD